MNSGYQCQPSLRMSFGWRRLSSFRVSINQPFPSSSLRVSLLFAYCLLRDFFGISSGFPLDFSKKSRSRLEAYSKPLRSALEAVPKQTIRKHEAIPKPTRRASEEIPKKLRKNPEGIRGQYLQWQLIINAMAIG